MRCKLVVDMRKIRKNVEKILNVVPKEKFMAVVKANAYGHGYEKVVSMLFEMGIKWYAVATYTEAIKLSDMGLDINILILGPTEKEEYKELEKRKIHFTVTNFSELEYIEKNCKSCLYHIAFDTGMGRIGFDKVDIEKVLENYKPTGIFTHLSVAENDKEYTKKQIDLFNEISGKYDIPYKHALNSYGSLNIPNDMYDLCRIGIIIYGGDKTREFEQAMSLYARVSYIKELKYDSYIGYGNTYLAKKGDIIATVSIGYADGLTRRISNNGQVFFNGKYYDIIGNICMDQMMIKADRSIKVGDFVEIYGDNICITKVADDCDTISYEIMCRNTDRLEKEYIY